MKAQLFSIIVPVYNVEKYLPHCLNSILQQTVADFELLLVDDGSTDHSGQICDDYAKNDTRIQVIHKQNEGVSKARNIALDKAQGKYICFVDSDDWIETSYLSTIMQQIEDYDILFFGCSFEYSDGNAQQLIFREQRTHDILGKENCMFNLRNNILKHNVFGYTWNKVFRTNIIKTSQLRFQEQISYGEDELFTLAYCMYAQSIKIIPDILYHYLQRTGSLIHQKDTCTSAKQKYKVISQLIPLMKSDSLKKEWHKCAYHILQDIAKHSMPNLLMYLKYQIEALSYKGTYINKFNNDKRE